MKVFRKLFVCDVDDDSRYEGKRLKKDKNKGREISSSTFGKEKKRCTCYDKFENYPIRSYYTRSSSVGARSNTLVSRDRSVDSSSSTFVNRDRPTDTMTHTFVNRDRPIDASIYSLRNMPRCDSVPLSQKYIAMRRSKSCGVDTFASNCRPTTKMQNDEWQRVRTLRREFALGRKLKEYQLCTNEIIDRSIDRVNKKNNSLMVIPSANSRISSKNSLSKAPDKSRFGSHNSLSPSSHYDKGKNTSSQSVKCNCIKKMSPSHLTGTNCKFCALSSTSHSSSSTVHSRDTLSYSCGSFPRQRKQMINSCKTYRRTLSSPKALPSHHGQIQAAHSFQQSRSATLDVVEDSDKFWSESKFKAKPCCKRISTISEEGCSVQRCKSEPNVTFLYSSHGFGNNLNRSNTLKASSAGVNKSQSGLVKSEIYFVLRPAKNNSDSNNYERHVYSVSSLSLEKKLQKLALSKNNIFDRGDRGYCGKAEDSNSSFSSENAEEDEHEERDSVTDDASSDDNVSGPASSGASRPEVADVGTQTDQFGLHISRLKNTSQNLPKLRCNCNKVCISFFSSLKYLHDRYKRSVTVH